MEHSGWANPEIISDSARVRGSYNPFSFVVSLSHGMYNLLEQQPGGIFKTGAKNLEHLDAFSTYFHETLHWWQHIGSTTGLLLSLTRPMQSHINYKHLKVILKDIGPQKPLEHLTKSLTGKYTSNVEDRLNLIVNNWYDLNFNRRIILNPQKISNLINSPYFESRGHSIVICLANWFLLLGATFDKAYHCIPDPRRWESTTANLRDQKCEGFFYGSTVRTATIGALHVFEGQSRFSQVQYLYLSTRGEMSWDAVRERGMLSGVYVEAFELFLKITGYNWPSTPVSAEVLLFLLICDLAINPSDGYPFDIRHFESLIESTDPGIRFAWFCSQAKKQPDLLASLEICGVEQYLEVSSCLCKSLVCATPVEIASELIKWISNGASFAELMIQHDTSNYTDDNLPLRLCFAKHLRFAKERIRRPEFFCWPAMYLVERKGADVNLKDSLEIFDKHQAPFLTHPSGEIRPAIFQGIPEQNTYKTFNSFYKWMLQYELIEQWIMQPGPFKLDFTWMHPLYTSDFAKPFADKAFKELFDTSLDQFIFI